MRRSIAVTALTVSIVGLGAAPALAADPPPEGPPEGVWSPLPEDALPPLDFEACGQALTIRGGDVLEAEERFTELKDGTTLFESRGSATVDILNAEGEVVIDELDLSGVSSALVSADGTEFVNILYGASIAFPFSGGVEGEAFMEALGTDLAYWSDPDESVISEFVVNPETGEVIEVTNIHVDADIVDLCEWIDGDHDDDKKHGDKD